jgi:hypothetical protein
MAGSNELSPVSDQLQSLIEAFDRLSEGEQQEFAAGVLRRTRSVHAPALDDETIDRLADESFVEYDIREAADGRG